MLNIQQATAESYNLIAFLDAKANYKELMTKILAEKSSHFSDDEFRKLHLQQKSSCIVQVIL